MPLADESLCQLCFRVQRRVRGGETVSHKIPRHRVECFSIALLAWSHVRDQNCLVILRSSRQNGSYERDANTSSLFLDRLVRLEALLFLFFGKKEYASWLTGTNRGAIPSPWR